MLFFERMLHAHQLTCELRTVIHPEFVLWATSTTACQASRKSYQTLETYGDTVLKVAGTMLAYNYLTRFEKNVDECKIDSLKNSFINNMYFFRIGKQLKLHHHIRQLDPDLKTWSPPFSEQVSAVESLSCTGKHIADVVESLIGAHFMTNNLHRSLQLISAMRIMPLQEGKVLDYFPDGDLTFELGADLDQYGF